MVKFTIPEDLRGKCKLFVNGAEYELPSEVESIDVPATSSGGQSGAGGVAKPAMWLATLAA
jgi:hypothetical protein